MRAQDGQEQVLPRELRAWDRYVDIRSKPGRGTRLVVRVPFRSAQSIEGQPMAGAGRVA